MTTLSELVGRLATEVPNITDLYNRVLKYNAYNDAQGLINNGDVDTVASLLFNGLEQPYSVQVEECVQSLNKEQLQAFYDPLKEAFLAQPDMYL